MNGYYQQGFMAKCAEAGVDPSGLVKTALSLRKIIGAQMAQRNQVAPQMLKELLTNPRQLLTRILRPELINDPSRHLMDLRLGGETRMMKALPMDAPLPTSLSDIHRKLKDIGKAGIELGESMRYGYGLGGAARNLGQGKLMPSRLLTGEEIMESIM